VAQVAAAPFVVRLPVAVPVVVRPPVAVPPVAVLPEAAGPRQSFRRLEAVAVSP